MEKVTSEVTYKNSASKTKLRQHEVRMTGDSFLRGITENVELSLSNNFGTFSLVKPGCELKTLLETANSAAGSLTQKDVIFICGGSNDFNLDTVKPTTDHIMEFLKTHNHTNIVLVNVPLRYDLSYYSQINKGIRTYNKKLLDITKEH
jgi:lysophospholipase L1-like esterase